MSELKAIRSGEIYNIIEYEDCYRTDDLYYPKSEADKVIADLEESHKKEVGQLLIEIAELKADYREACGRLQTANLIKDEQLAATRHSNHKRCLAMAERCSERFHHYVALSAFSPNKGAIPFYDKMHHKAYRWKYKWLKLAEQFKEAK